MPPSPPPLLLFHRPPPQPAISRSPAVSSAADDDSPTQSPMSRCKVTILVKLSEIELEAQLQSPIYDSLTHLVDSIADLQS
ncbi:hypothetical protein LINPERPRIM_LOCUS18612 [Linum perenne]